MGSETTDFTIFASALEILCGKKFLTDAHFLGKTVFEKNNLLLYPKREFRENGFRKWREAVVFN